ncbi:YbjN domain-containing protein [Candidatus Parcubacteria bacterium]|nr:YbjN domain-containing protein [Candidatus Parcubacteria bacterium]
MAEANKIGLAPLGLRLQSLYRKLVELNGGPDAGECLACHCDSAELVTLLESIGLDPKEVEAEVQKIAYDFKFVQADEFWRSGRLSSVPGRCGDGAYLTWFIAACYAVMSRQESR